jgi:hypothetical protein
MKKLILYLTDDQLFTILPTLQGACEDFEVESVDLKGSVGRLQREPDLVGAQAFHHQLDREPGISLRYEDDGTPVITHMDPLPSEAQVRAPKVAGKSIQKRDHKGRPPLKCLIEEMQERNRNVMKVGEGAKLIASFGFKEGHFSNVLRQGVREGLIRKLNNGRFSLVGATIHTLKNMEDLEVLREHGN